MFSISRWAVSSSALKSVAKHCRSVCSNQSLLSAGNAPSYGDSESKREPSSSGYGEKEICLLGPVDSRTPLPGNMGVAPVTYCFPDSSQSVPKHTGSKINENAFELPDDRYKNALSQLACATVEHVFSSHLLECKAHECPQLLRKDFAELFPNAVSQLDSLTVLTLSQKTEQDMSQWSEEAEAERATLEKSFIVTAQAICGVLKEVGYWADFIHPTSGKPFLGSSVTKATMFETDIRYSHFGFSVEDLGCCKVISHHLWGTHVFVGAIFTNAAVDSAEIRAILSKCKY